MTARSKIHRSAPPEHPLWIGFLGGVLAMFAFALPAIAIGESLPGRPIGFLVCLAMAGSFAVGSLTAFGASRLRREQRWRQGGMWIRCGYDLRASADRCPECGRRIRRKVTAVW